MGDGIGDSIVALSFKDAALPVSYLPAAY